MAFFVGRLLRNRKNRVFMPRVRLEDISDYDLVAYRFPRHLIQGLVEEYAASAFYEKSTMRSEAIPADVEMLAALRYFAKGGYLSELAKIQGISRSSVWRAVRNVSAFLCSIAKEHITMPKNENEVHATLKEFQDLHGMPCTLGCVDGSHVNIRAPNREEWVFVNRKQKHSINVQVVTDANLIIQDIEAKWPGSVHDMHMLRMSSVNERFESGEYEGYWLLGDSGYACQPWLLTPLLAPQTQAERRYNRCQKQARSSVERSLGVLKSRFRCLQQTLEVQPAAACKIIVACAVLHNMARRAKLPDLEEVPLQEEEEPAEPPIQQGRNGLITRQNLIDNYFS